MNKRIILPAIFLMVLSIVLLSSCTGSKKTPETAAAVNRTGTGSYKVTLIELGSVNCVPCRMMVPVLESIEKKYGDQVNVVFYDVWTEEEKHYAREYGIRAIPTQVFLDSSGQEFYRNEGFFPEEKVVFVLKQMGVE